MHGSPSDTHHTCAPCWITAEPTHKHASQCATGVHPQVITLACTTARSKFRHRHINKHAPKPEIDAVTGLDLVSWTARDGCRGQAPSLALGSAPDSHRDSNRMSLHVHSRHNHKDHSTLTGNSPNNNRQQQQQSVSRHVRLQHNYHDHSMVTGSNPNSDPARTANRTATRATTRTNKSLHVHFRHKRHCTTNATQDGAGFNNIASSPYGSAPQGCPKGPKYGGKYKPSSAVKLTKQVNNSTLLSQTLSCGNPWSMRMRGMSGTRSKPPVSSCADDNNIASHHNSLSSGSATRAAPSNAKQSSSNWILHTNDEPQQNCHLPKHIDTKHSLHRSRRTKCHNKQ